MVDDSGNKWKYLLKGNEDLRLDSRIMQLFTLINSLLQKYRFTLTHSLSVVQYSIIPFAPNVGFISWVTGSDTLQQLVVDFRQHRRIPRTLERDISNKIIGDIYNSLTSIQRIEIFYKIKKHTNANELRELLWLRSPTPTIWLQRNHNFTVSTALMSMAGYVIGLGDRHPSNIMIQRHTGRVIHIDFGDSFEVTMSRTFFPERVPFRMTRMIQNALDGGRVEGLFRRYCKDVMRVLRENQSSIIAQLEVFMHEPIFSERKVMNDSKKVLDRVAAKLEGLDPVEEGNENCRLRVGKQVDKLIEIAKDENLYIRHYMGWCPFW
ncbi:PIKK family atypical protein kinase [Histomonas meleagridis]|uniref:PIKK family atypical protein kinase n=1 Tax=Histomonas meleagridis TaxID=135588 RepID=UPI003559C1C3|nr:PIKK family atypical protein kinase [Histomonas meleagridis]KAH0801716.1 PIKK family atypical protein kinase [Histomonas meleagridis]